MDVSSNIIIGVNGSTAWNEEGCGRMVALFTSLVRDFDVSGAQIDISGADMLRDLVVMAFQTRDIRGGKGERELFRGLWRRLAPYLSVDQKKRLLELVPEYGCWGDLWKLEAEPANPLIVNMVAEQFARDEIGTTSLLAKWLPREGNKEQNVWVDAIRRALKCSRKQYRQRVSALNKHLKTVEIDMCGGTWANITPSAVPGRNMFLHRKAFLNLTTDNKPRHPNNEDRQACRETFVDFFAKVSKGDATIKGADVLMPHEIIRELEKTSKDTPEGQALEGQWRAAAGAATAGTDGLKKMICLADFSGSMEGRPIQVAMALGIMVSENTSAAAFKNRLITFSEEPMWIEFNEEDTIWDKIRKCRRSPWGNSTNFEAAYELVLNRLIADGVEPGGEPDDLLVVTDMGWDEATYGHGFHLDNLKAKFAAAGSWKVPRIIIWNVSAKFKEYQATEATPGVVMISGWHPSILARLMDGVKVTTPWEAMRWVLDSPRYDAVRAAMTGLKDHALSDN